MSMTSWKDIEVPEKMESLKKDHRGFPIPHAVLIDSEGTPHFKVNDSRKRDRCVKYKICSICGKPMARKVDGKIIFDMWMVGGPGSAFHKNGAFIDGPVHEECSTYALKVCPYLAARNYMNHMDIDKVIDKVKTDDVLLVDPTMDPNRPKAFIQIQIEAYKVIREGNGTYIIPKRPYLDVRYWNKGFEIDVVEASELIGDEWVIE